MVASELQSDDGATEIYMSVGEVVAGKYVVERVLGVGGMAFVLSAKHIELDERFALKFLARAFLAEEVIIERFTREAKAACRIRSEHVVRVHDVGTHHGAPFLVMEHLTGRDLATALAERGPLGVEEAVEYTMQACEALAVAHAQGIVHRDIKPENLFLVEQEGLPRVKLLDFGISKIALTGGDAATRLTGHLSLGTPCYMSPEQIRSTASADAASDLWSLGVVLYELLTATQAFSADTIPEMCAAVLETEPRPLRELRPEVPPELAAVVERCMRKDAAERFANVAELALALLPFAPSRALVCAERSSSVMRATRPTPRAVPRISSVRPRYDAPASSSPVALDTPMDAELPPRAPRRSGLLGLSALALFGAATALAVVALARDPAPDPAGASSAAPPAATELAATPVTTRPLDPPAAQGDAAIATAVRKRAVPSATAAGPRPRPPGPPPVAPDGAGPRPAEASSAVHAPPARASVELGY